MVARVRQTSGRPEPDFGQKWTCANETEPSMTEYDIANRTMTKATEQNRIDPNKKD